MKTTNDYIRLREVLKLTGWDKKYVRKLVENGVLVRWAHYAGGRSWYSRTQVVQLISPPKPESPLA